MKLNIEKVKTLYSIYKIIYQKKVMLNNKEVEGLISYSRNLFKISTRNTVLHQLETIMHEYYHATFYELEIEQESEKKVNTLARSLVKFIRENPELVKIILDYKGEEVSG